MAWQGKNYSRVLQTCLTPLLFEVHSGESSLGAATRGNRNTCRFYSAIVSSNKAAAATSVGDSFRLLSSLGHFKSKIFRTAPEMSYFVIGVSGVTCGGKTSLTKLLQRSFPWARIIHQDHFFYDDDWPQHIRVPDAENHVNYEILNSLDMPKMYKDVQDMLDGPPQFTKSDVSKIQSDTQLGDKAETPNFDDKFLQQVKDINMDTSKYNHIPILIIEGFTIFASQFLFDKCDVRFFCSLDKETCRERRSIRTYFPPDSKSYFDKVIWPEYETHFESFINKRSGLRVFDGKTPIEYIWKTSQEIVACRIEEKYGSSVGNTISNAIV